MPYSHDYVPQVNVESYKPLPRATIPLSEKTIVTKGGSDSHGRFTSQVYSAPWSSTRNPLPILTGGSNSQPSIVRPYEMNRTTKSDP
jgi:hypothetical protein